MCDVEGAPNYLSVSNLAFIDWIRIIASYDWIWTLSKGVRIRMGSSADSYLKFVQSLHVRF